MKFELTLSWFATFTQLLLRSSWGVVAVAIAEIIKLNSIEIGTVISLFYLGYVTSSMMWGYYIDYVGPKRVIFISALLSSLFLIPLLFSLNIIELYVIYFVEGLVTSGLYPSSVKIIASLSSQVIRYIALLDSSAPVVLLLVSLLSPLLLSYWLYFFVVLILAFLLISLLTFNANVEHIPNRDVRKVYLNRRVIIASVIRGGEQWGLWGSSSWLFPFLVLYDNIGKFFSEILFFIFAIGQLFSIFIAGKVSKEREAVILSLLIFIISTFVLAFFKESIILITFTFLLGISSFLCRPPTDTLILKIMGKENAGKSMGIANAISQLGSFLAPFFVGVAIYFTSPTFAILGLAIGPFVSLALVLLLKV